MTRRTASSVALVASTILGMVACSDIGPGAPQNTIAVIVSAPVRLPAGALARGAAAAASTSLGTSVVYVSLSPGAVPTGVQAAITNQATGWSVTTALMNGGFDPVPLAASIGDTLAIDITSATSTALAHVRLAVSAIRPLKVVRTSPPAGGRDVPLNATVVIVFSEPIDPSTVTTGAIQLLRDSTPVAGTVQLRTSPDIMAEFLPATLLAPQTAYRLVVSSQIRTLAGVALASPLSVAFTTGVTVQPQVAATLAFTGQPGNATAGTTISPPVVVTIQDSLGRTVTTATDVVAVNSTSLWFGLGGTVAVRAVNGVATFSDLRMDHAATGYTLAARSGILRAATSAPFDISPAGPAGLLFQPAPGVAGIGVATVGQPFSFDVAIVDTFRNTVTSAGNAVTVSLDSSPSGATLGGTLTVTAVQGLAHFANLTVDQVGTYTLVATAGTVARARSDWHAYTPGTFIAVSAGGAHTCGENSAGVWYCWGSNAHGQLGDGTTIDRSTPVQVTGALAFSSLSAGSNHTCGVTPAGAAYCWGLNDGGQLGDGTTTDRTTPVLVAGGLRFEGLAPGMVVLTAGASHTCGLVADTIGEPFTYCWGLNDHGQLGDGTTSRRTSPTPVAPTGSGLAPLQLDNVSAGGGYTCGLNYDTGADYCWGNNSNGQLDDGTTTDRASPTFMVLVPCGSGPPNFVPPVGCPSGFVTPFNPTVTAGGAHTCAHAGGSYYMSFAWYCWGANGSGQLGDGTTTDRKTWVLVGGGRSFTIVSAGGSHTCGVAGGSGSVAGAAYCWGDNSAGQLGTGSTIQQVSPALVAGGLSFTAVSAGGSHTCGVIAGGGVYCWGGNSTGQLGTGTTTGSSVPVKVAGQP